MCGNWEKTTWQLSDICYISCNISIVKQTKELIGTMHKTKCVEAFSASPAEYICRFPWQHDSCTVCATAPAWLYSALLTYNSTGLHIFSFWWEYIYIYIGSRLGVQHKLLRWSSQIKREPSFSLLKLWLYCSVTNCLHSAAHKLWTFCSHGKTNG